MKLWFQILYKVWLKVGQRWTAGLGKMINGFMSYLFYRYFLRVTIVRRISDIVKEQDIVVHTLSQYPEMNSSIKMEVGIEDCLHIEFEYNKSKWVFVSVAFSLEPVVLYECCVKIYIFILKESFWSSDHEGVVYPVRISKVTRTSHNIILEFVEMYRDTQFTICYLVCQDCTDTDIESKQSLSVIF